MKKIIYIVSILIINIQIFANPNYKPLTQAEIQEILGSNVRTIQTLNGEWEKQTKYGTEKVNIPYTEYHTIETEYTKTINLNRETLNSKNVLLSFLGLAGDIELFINGAFLVKINGEGLHHTINIPTNLLNEGSNTIRLRCLGISNYYRDLIHSSLEHPKPFIGIIREVFVVFTSRIYIKAINQFPDNKQIKISVDVQSGTDDAGDYKVEWILKNDLSNDPPVLNSSVITKIESSSINNVTFHIQKEQLERWSVNNPVVYTLTVKLKKGDTELDNYIIHVANKTLTTDKDIFINGNPIKLLCIEYDEYFPGIGYTRSYASLKNDIKKLKSMGVNSLLFNYTNPSPMLLDLCIKNGIIVLLTHNTSNLNLTTENVEYATNSLENKLNIFANKSAISAIGVYNENYIDKINKNKYLTYNIADKLDNKMNATNFCIYDIGYDVTERTLEHLRINSYNNNYPVLLLAKALYRGERLTKTKSTLYNRQSIRYKDLFEVYQTLGFAGYIAEGFRDRELAYPNFYNFNYNNNKLKKGLIDNKEIERHSLNVVKQLYRVEKTPLLNEPEFEINYSNLYLIIAILITLITAFLLKKDNKLFKVFKRSFRRGHNLYCDIRDKRISFSLNIYLLLLIELFTIAVACSIFIDFSVYKYNFSYFLSLILPFNSLLNLFNNIFYSQIFLLITNFLIICVATLIIALFLRVIFAIYRVKTAFSIIFYLLAFILTPFLSLALFAIFLGKLLIMAKIIYPIFIIFFIILTIGLIKRTSDSVSVIADIKVAKSLLLIVGSLLLFIILPLYLYFNEIATFTFILHLIMS
ncbi:MAG: hypothetical protein FWG85_01815 [Bacteroidetes bacterium]|nr:hypothetical protein [Bacteroidota bacterium]